MINKKIKSKYFIIGSILLIFFLSITMLIIFFKTSNKRLIKLANYDLKKDIYQNINNLSSEIANDEDINNLLSIYQNEQGEILYASYDVKKSYKVLNNVSKKIEQKLNRDVKSHIYNVSIFAGSKFIFLNHLGPKINYKIDYLNMTLSNIHTKITNYGLNNALVEIYVKLKIDGNVITPLTSSSQNIEYDILLSSSIINGRVPSLYGSSINVSSILFDIPILI